MSENKQEETEKEDRGTLSRREFLKDAGLAVGGATLGSTVLFGASCNNSGTGGATVTVTKTVSGSGTGAVTISGAAQAATDLLALTVNGETYYVQAKDHWTLAYVLREKLNLTGTKRACNDGSCGICTVLMDGRPVMSCIILAVEAAGKDIRTIEGEMLANKQLSPLQQAFVDGDAIQCGLCIPGMIMTAKALLAFKPKPTKAEVKEFLSGTLCRCGVHILAIDAILKVAG